MKRLILIFLFAQFCLAQTYDYAPTFIPIYPNGSGSYVAAATSSGQGPVYDNGPTFIPLCVSSAAGVTPVKYQACAAPNSSGSSATPVMPQASSLLGAYLINEGAGTVAHDSSGKGNDATITNPIWEGTSDLQFQNTYGTPSFVTLPTALNAAKAWQMAIFVPPYLPLYDVIGPPQLQGDSDPGIRYTYASFLCGTDNAHMCLIANDLSGNSGSGKATQHFAAFNTDGTESQTNIPFGWHVFTLVCGTSSANPTHYLFDGVETGGYLTQGYATCPSLSTAAGSGNYQLGGSATPYGTTIATGKLGAAWAWSVNLSLAEGVAAAKAALAYLNTKGLPLTNLPYVATTPQIVAGTDSRTFGQGLTQQQAWPTAMSITDSTYARVNLGVSGSQITEMCLQFDSVYGQVIAGNQNTIAMFWGGVNDIDQAAIPVRLIANAMKCMTQKAKALGARVIVATEISSLSTNGTTGDTGKNALDPIIRNEWQAWGADNLADLATSPQLGADGASSSTVNFQDQLHPTTTGEGYVSAIMGEAVNELLGSTETTHHTTAAATYTEVSADRWLDLTGTATQTITLPTCIGKSLQRFANNLGTSTANFATTNGETLTGLTTLTPNGRAIFLPVPGALATGGCSWERVQ